MLLPGADRYTAKTDDRQTLKPQVEAKPACRSRQSRQVVTDSTAAVGTQPRAPRAAGLRAYDAEEEVFDEHANAGGDAGALLPVAHRP